MRYRGQSYELEVAITPRFIAEFHSLHRQTFGHATPGAPVEVVNIRIRAIAAGSVSTAPKKIARIKSKAAPISRAAVMVADHERIVPIYSRDSLGAGTRLRGPIVVVELSSTTYVAPEFELRVDDFGNLQLEAAR
jgi:N-methylhydantoinase A